MRRILGAVVLLLILITAWVVCQDRRKDVIPTHIEPLPNDPPQPVHDRSPD